MENEGNGTMKIFGGVTVTTKRLEVGGVLGWGVIKESLQKYREVGWGGELGNVGRRFGKVGRRLRIIHVPRRSADDTRIGPKPWYP